MKDFLNVCRLCLKNREDCVDEFSNISDHKDLTEMIFTCTEIKITFDDKLPKNVCSDCLKSISKFYEFKNMCRDSDENLQKYLNLQDEQTNRPEEEIQIESKSVTINDVLLEFQRKNCKKLMNDDHRIRMFKTDETIRKIIGNNIYTCEICSEEFTAFFDYFDHQESHDGQFVFKCSKCEEVFCERRLLVEHDYKHKIPCKLCKLEVLPKSMNAHLLIHTDVYRCRECGARHTSNAALERHVKARHRGVKGIICHICGKQSSCLSSLNRHMAYHSSERPHKCKHCNFTAKSLNILQVHTSRRHFAEKCICDICAKLFKSQHSLVQHVKRIHTVKKHICDVCGKAFVERHNLNKHVKKKHVGQRLHECKVCEKEFFTIRTLKEHMHTHKQGCVNCSKCKKTFFYKKYYERHVIKCR